MGWLRAELELLQPEILALQECPSEAALPCLYRLFTLVGTAKAHAGYVHLYVLSNCDMQTKRMGSMRRNVPAVAAEVKVGAQTVVVVAAHLAANTRGALEGAKEGPAERVVQMRAIVEAVASPVAPPVVLLGDLNVRDDKVAGLLEAGEWRDAAYHGKSLDPYGYNLRGDVTLSGPKFAEERVGRFVSAGFGTESGCRRIGWAQCVGLLKVARIVCRTTMVFSGSWTCMQA